jgi:ABC-2 type transport system permease protein
MEGMLNTVMTVNWLEFGFYFILFFIGGYILYASIFAMFASAVDSEEDTSQL